MRVKVKVFAKLRELVKNREIDVELKNGSTIIDLLTTLTETYGDELKSHLFSENGALKKHFTIYVNGVGVDELGGVKVVLKDGDVVAILPPISGG